MKIIVTIFMRYQGRVLCSTYKCFQGESNLDDYLTNTFFSLQSIKLLIFHIQREMIIGYI